MEPNAKKKGRKPIEDKKKPITIFVKESVIAKIGKETLMYGDPSLFKQQS